MNSNESNKYSLVKSNSTTVILSSTIIFRHGARGPGKSEVSPWEKSHPIVTQWNDDQFERLTDTGFHQMQVLGAYYSERCKIQNLQMPSCDSYRFYSSKENRSKVSGQVFVSSFLNTYAPEVQYNELK